MHIQQQLFQSIAAVLHWVFGQSFSYWIDIHPHHWASMCLHIVYLQPSSRTSGLKFRLLQWNFWIQMIQYDFSEAFSNFMKHAKHLFFSCYFSLGLYKWLNEHFPILLMISIFLSWDLAAGGCCWSFDFKFFFNRNQILVLRIKSLEKNLIIIFREQLI